MKKTIIVLISFLLCAAVFFAAFAFFNKEENNNIFKPSDTSTSETDKPFSESVFERNSDGTYNIAGKFTFNDKIAVNGFVEQSIKVYGLTDADGNKVDGGLGPDVFDKGATAYFSYYRDEVIIVADSAFYGLASLIIDFGSDVQKVSGDFALWFRNNTDGFVE